MQNKEILSILSEWTDEFNSALINNNSLCIALFSADRKLLFANNSMSALFKGDPAQSLINPTFDKILLLDNSIPLVFEGVLTLGDYYSVNTSIWAQIYRKKSHLLIVGGVDTSQLLEQNETMHQLNREISNLQRELIREKHSLENTLKQLNQANDELKELNATQNKFFSIIAHDLKNPFNAILGFSYILLQKHKEYDDENRERIINTVHDSANSAFKLLENLLTWSRSQSGRINYSPEELHLKILFFETMYDLQAQADKKEIQVIDKISENEIVFADKNMLATILRNIISNAIKFTKKNETIVVYSEKQANTDFVEISVLDTGVGIAKDKIDGLFMIDKNISTQGTENETGTGLGLILCKEFVERHGGKIWAESEVGKGSVFKFTMPIKDLLEHD